MIVQTATDAAMVMAEQFLGGKPMIEFMPGYTSAFEIQMVGGLLDLGFGGFV